MWTFRFPSTYWCSCQPNLFLLRLANSVPGFGKILPLWQNLKVFGIFDGLFGIGKILNLDALARNLSKGQNVHCCKRPNVEKIIRRLVTLLARKRKWSHLIDVWVKKLFIFFKGCHLSTYIRFVSPTFCVATSMSFNHDNIMSFSEVRRSSVGSFYANLGSNPKHTIYTFSMIHLVFDQC